MADGLTTCDALPTPTVMDGVPAVTDDVAGTEANRVVPACSIWIWPHRQAGSKCSRNNPWRAFR